MELFSKLSTILRWVQIYEEKILVVLKSCSNQSVLIFITFDYIYSINQLAILNWNSNRSSNAFSDLTLPKPTRGLEVDQIDQQKDIYRNHKQFLL